MLVSNWTEVLKKSMVVWVGVLGALLPEVPDLVLKWLASDASTQLLTPETKSWIRAAILLFVVPFVRIWRQQSLTSATERRLQEEKITRERLEQVATSAGPPISPEQVQAIKRDAAVAAASAQTFNPQPLKE